MNTLSHFKGLINIPTRSMATETQNYFKRVVHEHTPPGKKRWTLERELLEGTDYAELRAQKMQAMMRSQNNKVILGMQDYEIEDYKSEGYHLQQLDYKGLIKGKLPEDQIELHRYELEVLNQLIPGLEVALFNLPYDITQQELKDIYSKYGSIDKLEIVNSVMKLPAYAIVTYKSHKSFDECLFQAKDIWIRNNLVKVRTAEDASVERLEDKTIVLGNIPTWATQEDILNLVHNFGSVLKIDMPMTDARIEDAKNSKPNPENEAKLQRTYEERLHLISKTHAMPLSEKILNYEKDLYKTKVLHQSPKVPANLSVINKEKRLNVLTLCTMVYNENQLVNESLKDIKAQRDNLVNRLNNVMEYPSLPDAKNTETFISPEQIKSLQSYLSYVNKNHDSLPPEILSQVNKNRIFQVIQEYKGAQGSGSQPELTGSADLAERFASQISQSNSELLQELADGYQLLLDSCTRREKILQHRLDRLLKDYGNLDRVLYEVKDPNRELEDIDYEITPVGQDVLKPEDIISVSEQIRNIMNWKNSPRGTDFKFRKENALDYEIPNFNTHDLETAKLNEHTVDGTELRQVNKGHNIDMTKLKNNKMWFNNHREEVLQEYWTRVFEARNNLDMPFDQMYHKEKALIDNLVKAEKDLQEALIAQETELQKHTGSVENSFDPESIGLLESEDDVRVLLKSYQLKNEKGSEDSADSLFASDRIKTNYRQAIEQCMDNLSKGYTSKIKKIIEKHAYLQNRGY